MARKAKDPITPEFIEKVFSFIEKHPHCAFSDMKNLHSNEQRTREAIKVLRDNERIIMNGSRRGARYCLPGISAPEKEPVSSSRSQNRKIESKDFNKVDDLVMYAKNSLVGEYTIGDLVSKIHELGQEKFAHSQISSSIIKFAHMDVIKYQRVFRDGHRIVYTMGI